MCPRYWPLNFQSRTVEILYRLIGRKYENGISTYLSWKITTRQPNKIMTIKFLKRMEFFM
jgi:hypothetical protein